MLRPGARRKDVLRQLHRTSEKLILPFLCPALLQYQNHSRHQQPITHLARPAGSYVSKRSISQTSKHRATASPPPFSIGDHYIPFEPEQLSKVAHPWDGGLPHHDLLGFDPSSLVILDEVHHESDGYIKEMKAHDGVGGNVTEMRIVFDACLRIHRYKRAAALLTRFAILYVDNKPALLELHNQYLQSMVSEMIMNRRIGQMAPLQKWFEVEMRTRGCQLEPDATTYALMIKASLHMLHGSKGDRTVRRYWSLAQDAGIENEVLSLPILTDSEIGKVTEICPMDLFSLDFMTPQFEPTVLESGSLEGPANASQETLPDVRPAPQKGLGLSALKESLSLFSEDSQATLESEWEGTAEDLAKLRQERLERDAITSALEKWRKENEELKAMGIDPALQTKSVGSDLWMWAQALQIKIQEELHEFDLAEGKKHGERTEKDILRRGYAPFLGLVSPERLSVVAIVGIMHRIVHNYKEARVTLASLAVGIGQMVAREYEAEAALKEKDARSMTSFGFNRRGQRIAKMLRKKHQRLSNVKSVGVNTKIEAVSDDMTYIWTKDIQCRVGALLVSLLLDAAKVAVPIVDPKTHKKRIVQKPVFTHALDFVNGRVIGVIRTAPEMLAKLAKEPSSNLLSKQLPMLCTPKPWQNVRDGGFLVEKFEVLRGVEKSQTRYLQAAADKGDLDELFAGLDVLGRTPWKVNQDVLRIMLEGWNTGDEVANFRPEAPIIEYPSKPDDMQDTDAKREYHRAMLEADNLIGGYHSERCFHNLQLEIARSYANETFYFPHNMDFRGRAYPLSSYLNQMGADHCRGLLMFANGKPLGSSGLRWLKIQLANVYGFDKASFQEREDFSISHLPEIYDSATNPLGGKKWWLKAEDPWQTLAACIELKKALDSPDPAAFVSHLAVHQDGSCNGLQHYAALGGDIVGAQQVNLEPGDRPADVYSGVAEMVKKEIDDDAATGLQIAKDLQGKITRKVVKQPVMTNVYGVTFIGAKDQVEKQLINLIPGIPRHGEGFNSFDASSYIAKKIFKALSSMFTGAHEIQYWFGLCGNRIATSLSPSQIDKIERDIATPPSSRKKAHWSKKRKPLASEDPEFRNSIIWTTPLKLPVVQPYRKDGGHKIKTVLQELTVQSPNSSHIVNKRRQLQAFPPNFIHSLDATHMIMSALKCSEHGLDFAAVHDSFWTHPCDVDTLNTILRDAFIRMHSDNIIGRLAAEFNVRYKDHMYLCRIPARSEIGKRIKECRKVQAKDRKTRSMENRHKFREVVLERKRIQLLSSSDPKEVEEGKAMVTPGSIFAEHMSSPMSTADIASVESDVTSHQLGAVPKTPEQMEAASKAEEVSSTSTRDVADLFTDEMHEDEGEAVEAAVVDEESKKPEKKKQKTPPAKTWVWLPLTFPEVPKKGAFDVRRLRDSTYFFS